MSIIRDVSDKLGQRMLSGWILTNDSCPNSGCNMPLMRSPNGRTPVAHWCAQCDDPQADVTSTQPESISVHQPSPSASSSSHPSRVSTPPTEFSSSLSSPTFAPPAETPESLRRRQQSDTASSEIGKRLLKGWAMLAEECPNIRCYGVPLVRPPKAGGGKDPRKECVICGTVYVTEIDPSGWERLVNANPTASTTSEHQRAEDIVPASSSGTSTFLSTSHLKGKAIARDETPQASYSVLPSPVIPPTSTATLKSLFPLIPPTTSFTVPKAQSSQGVPSVSALEVSTKSLELTLYTLSERLTLLSSGQSPLDPASIALTADAMGKAAGALAQIKQLHWSETGVRP